MAGNNNISRVIAEVVEEMRKQVERTQDVQTQVHQRRLQSERRRLEFELELQSRMIGMLVESETRPPRAKRVRSNGKDVDFPRTSSGQAMMAPGVDDCEPQPQRAGSEQSMGVPLQEPQPESERADLPGPSRETAPAAAGLDPGVGGDNGGTWLFPGILVRIHRDDREGVITAVHPGGSCRVASGSIGEGEVITALSDEISVVAPTEYERVKILGGRHRGATGTLIACTPKKVYVSLDDPEDVVSVYKGHLGKLVQR